VDSQTDAPKVWLSARLEISLKLVQRGWQEGAAFRFPECQCSSSGIGRYSERERCRWQAGVIRMPAANCQ
jgi:hypothetical protein